MFKISSKTDTIPKGIQTSNRYGNTNRQSKDLSGSRNKNLRSMKASSTEPNNSGIQSFRNKIITKKMKIQGNNPTAKISPSMSLYASKDKTEEYFSEKIKDIISNDPSLKHSSMRTFCSTTHDKWKPEGYIYYDFLLKHPLMMKSEPLSSKFDQKFPPLNQQILKDRNTTSHIFEDAKVQIAPQAFYQPQTSLTPTAQVRYAASDIFNQNHSNPELYLRSGEKYLFKQNQPIPYSTTTESHSDWVPKTVSRPTLINHTSVKWNIICPSCKSLFKTKNEVKEEVKEYYKVNSLSEFVDRTRVSAPNLNKVFRDAMNKEKNCFALKNDVATNYGDMHHSYRELFPKSFWN